MLIVPSDNRVLYYGRDRGTFRFLSHFHPAVIEMDGETWPTVEHYYQAQKSDVSAYRQAIRQAKTPVRPSAWRRTHAGPAGSARGPGFERTKPSRERIGMR